MLQLVQGALRSKADFAEFWSLYPRRVAKKEAEKAFKQIHWTPELWEEVKAAIEAWKGSEQWQKDGGAYIPHASTWLRGERWTDELAVVVQAMSACAWPKCKGAARQTYGSRGYCEAHVQAFKRGETP